MIIAAAALVSLTILGVTYDYQPIFGPNWIVARQIRHESTFNVRARQNHNIGAAQSLAIIDCT